MYPEFSDYFWSNLEITFNLRDVSLHLSVLKQYFNSRCAFEHLSLSSQQTNTKAGSMSSDTEDSDHGCLDHQTRRAKLFFQSKRNSIPQGKSKHCVIASRFFLILGFHFYCNFSQQQIQRRLKKISIRRLSELKIQASSTRIDNLLIGTQTFLPPSPAVMKRKRTDGPLRQQTALRAVSLVSAMLTETRTTTAATLSMHCQVRF